MDDEIKFLRRPVDTLRLGLAAAREVGASTKKHPVQVMQEEVRDARTMDGWMKTRAREEGGTRVEAEISTRANRRANERLTDRVRRFRRLCSARTGSSTRESWR